MRSIKLTRVAVYHQHETSETAPQPIDYNERMFPLVHVLFKVFVRKQILAETKNRESFMKPCQVNFVPKCTFKFCFSDVRSRAFNVTIICYSNTKTRVTKVSHRTPRFLFVLNAMSILLY